MADNSYVHGYSSREAERLLDQAQTLTDLLHHDTRYPAGSRVLEAGCGVGAQTVMLAAGSPDASFTCIDCSEKSLAEAEAWIQKTGGTITVIEGDHGSAYFHPDSVYARDAISCLVTLQKEAGGNALVGRELYPLLTRSGFSQVSVSPRMVYVDASRPALVEGFTKLTFTAMVEGVREEALFRGMMTGSDWDRGIADLYRTCEPDGVFCYTFFKAIGVRK